MRILACLIGLIAMIGSFGFADGATAAIPIRDDAPPVLSDDVVTKSDLTVSLGVAAMVRPTVDINGVDLTSGEFSMAVEEVSVGQASEGGLVYSRVFVTDGWRDNQTGTIHSSGTTYTVSLGGASESFTLAAGVYTPDQGGQATLTYNAGAQIYTYTARSGAVATFAKAYAGTTPFQANEGRITSLTEPNGKVTTYTYTTATISGTAYYRLQSVTNNLGYHLKLEYASNGTTDLTAWITLAKVTGINGAVDYCSPTATSCTGLTGTWTSATYASPSSNVQTVTDSLGRVTRYTYDGSGHLTAVRRPSSGSDNVTIAYHSGTDRVSSVSNGTGTWTYAYTGTLTTTVTDPLSHTRIVVSSGGQMTSDTDGTGKTVSYTYDGSGRLSTITMPEGNYITYAYDSRDNVIQTTATPKSGSGLSNIVTYASYDTTCVYLVKCNQPNSTTDALGNVVDYTYDTTHGGMLTITAPPPAGGGIRPQTRLTYSSLYAYLKNSGGTIVAAATPVYRVATISSCRSTSSCSGGLDETKTTYTYGTTGVANNLLVTTEVSGAGNASLTVTKTMTYSGAGDLLTVDGPLSGTNDITRYRYDSERQLIGEVGPDPDAGGSLKHRATRLTYDSDGQVTLVERGTVNSQSDGDWASFSLLGKVETTYDTLGRKVKDALIVSGTTKAVTQFTYDNANRLDCVAIRMNASVFGSLPGSACTLGTTGSDGPDRITKHTYDAADRMTQVTAAYGTSAARNEATYTYSFNGKPATITDGRGQKTTYEYDGFDRVKKVRYPDPSNIGSSSTTDYEQYTYNAGSKVTQERRRDASTINYSYDDLGRLTTGFGGATYTYNNTGAMLSATLSGVSNTFTYDALNRKVSETGPQGTVSYQYDATGQRTRLTWPDSVYVTYEYNTAGDPTAIKLSGSTSLAAFTYDDMGRRTGLTRGNGVTTAYGYDALSELDSIVNNLTGTTGDQTLGFTHNLAGQIVGRTNSNSNYAFTSVTPASRSYTATGQNQYSQVGGLDFYDDGAGNLAFDGVNTYGYSDADQLTSVSSATMSFDNMGRLYETTGGSTTRFQYDGDSLIAEYNTSGTVLRRYVHGPGLDEPIVWYEGSNTATSKYLVADKIGSITAVTDSSGAATAYNTYDEAGVSGGTLTGRFGFTGQAWVPEAGMYNYKARFYSPSLGRFMQTDPIGYENGGNLYAYTGNDPVNNRDPSGTDYIMCNDSMPTRPDVPGDICWTVRIPNSICRVSSNCIIIPAGDLMPGGSTGTPTGGTGGGSPGGGGGPTTGDVDELVINGRKTGVLDGVKIDWRLPQYQEQLWVVLIDGTIIYVPTVGTKVYDTCGNELGKSVPDGTVTMPPPAQIFAIIHTHPPSWAADYPAAGDYGKRYHVYGISRNGAWVIRPGADRGSRPVTLSGRAPTRPSGSGKKCALKK